LQPQKYGGANLLAFEKGLKMRKLKEEKNTSMQINL